MTRKADRETNRQFRRRHRQQIVHDSHPYVAAGARLDIEIVVALKSTGDDLELRAGCKKRGVDGIGHEGHHGVRFPAPRQDLIRRQSAQCVVR